MLLLPPLRAIIAEHKVSELHRVQRRDLLSVLQAQLLASHLTQTRGSTERLRLRRTLVSDVEDFLESGRGSGCVGSGEKDTECFSVFEGLRGTLALVGKHW